MTDDTKHYKLRLQFDGAQVSGVLLYRFEHNGRDAMTKEGRYTGCIQFKKGDTIAVEATMTATMEETVTVDMLQVISLDLVAQPNIHNTIESFSPFISDQVTKSLIGQWSEPQMETNNKDGVTKWVSTWEGDPLTVIAEKGYWQLSGFLGAVVYRTMGTAPIRVPRVLSFDPETSSGEGADPD